MDLLTIREIYNIKLMKKTIEKIYDFLFPIDYNKCIVEGCNFNSIKDESLYCGIHKCSNCRFMKIKHTNYCKKCTIVKKCS
jgi:hypothetical protein